MKVGDYVRTTNGISKIVAFYSNAIYNDKNKRIENDLIVKSSPNIIDLIEVGDYVNGGIVKEITKHYIRTNGTKELLFQLIDKDKIEDIKSIVTKEQFESIKYEVLNPTNYIMY